MAPRWRANVEQHIDKLRKTYNNMTHARVTLEKNRHHKKGQVATAKIVLSVSGATITASKTEKTFEEAIKSAFLAAARELKVYRDKLNATDVPPPPLPPA
jgi:ribosome-associated translation inhibitor RaiA